MSTFHVNPESARFPYLVAGEYGPSRPFESDVEITRFEIPAEENPPYDREGARGPYAYIEFTVRSDDRGFVKLRHFEAFGDNSGSKLLPWMKGLGLATDEGEVFVDQVEGTKCAIEVGDPKQSNQDPNRWFTGRLLAVTPV